MHVLGKSFRETIRERLDHDLGIVVMCAGETLGDGLFADTCRDGEASDVIREPARFRRDEVGKRGVGTLAFPRDLLPERVEGGDPLRALFIRINCDVIVVFGVRGPKADDAIGDNPAFIDDLPEHGLCIGMERGRGLAVAAVEDQKETYIDGIIAKGEPVFSASFIFLRYVGTTIRQFTRYIERCSRNTIKKIHGKFLVIVSRSGVWPNIRTSNKVQGMWGLGPCYWN